MRELVPFSLQIAAIVVGKSARRMFCIRQATGVDVVALLAGARARAPHLLRVLAIYYALRFVAFIRTRIHGTTAQTTQIYR